VNVPLKVSEIIKLIEADGWYLVATRGSHRPNQARTGYGGRQGKRGLATGDRAKHPEAGRHNREGTVTSYAVVIERADDGGYGAWSPDLPGVVALGDTEAEALEEMRRAIEFHLEGLRADGLPIPQAVS
jgi:predicted RNase H-like HicB family nuclease